MPPSPPLDLSASEVVVLFADRFVSAPGGSRHGRPSYLSGQRMSDRLVAAEAVLAAVLDLEAQGLIVLTVAERPAPFGGRPLRGVQADRTGGGEAQPAPSVESGLLAALDAQGGTALVADWVFDWLHSALGAGRSASYRAVLGRVDDALVVRGVLDRVRSPAQLLWIPWRSAVDVLPAGTAARLASDTDDRTRPVLARREALRGREGLKIRLVHAVENAVGRYAEPSDAL